MTVDPLSACVTPAGAECGTHTAESGAGFAETLAQLAGGVEEASADARSHPRRGLPERADVRGRLDRLARHWAVLELSTPSLSETISTSSASTEGSGTPVVESTHLERGSNEPHDGEAPQLLLATLVTGVVSRELSLVPPKIVAVERAESGIGISGRAADVARPDARPDEVQLAGFAARSDRVGELALVPSEGNRGRITSETIAERPDRAPAEPMPLVAHPRDSVGLNAAGEVRRAEPPASPAAPAPASGRLVPFVVGRQTAGDGAAPLAAGAAHDGDWIRHARAQLRAAIEASRPGGESEPAQSARLSTSPGTDHALESSVSDDARRLEATETVDAPQSKTSSRGEGTIGRRRGPRPTVREAMFEAVRSAARAAGSQMAAFGPTNDPTPMARATESRARSLAALAAPAGPPVGVGATSAAAPGSREVAPRFEPDVELTLTSQIVQAIRVQWGANGGDVLIRLHPEYLGELTVSLKVEQGMVSAHLESSMPEVRRWIETHEGVLRQGLAGHDLRLDRLVVTTASDVAAEHDGSGASTGRQAPGDTDSRHHDQSPRRRPGQDSESPAFEVIV